MNFISLSELLRGSGDSERIVALRGSERIDLQQLRSDVAENAARLQRLNARRALLVTDDAYHFVIALLALASSGIDIVLPPNAQPGTISGLQEEVDLIVSDDHRLVGYHVAQGVRPADPLVLDSKATVLSFFTSGSTGEPKCVRKTLQMVEAEAAELERLWGNGLDQGAVYGTVSHQHAYGLPFRVIWPLCGGRPFSTRTHYLWEGMVSEMTGPGVIVSSPSHLSRFGAIEPVPCYRRPIRVFSAGSPLSIQAERDCARILGVKPIEIFGSTETGIVAWKSEAGPQGKWAAFAGVSVSAVAEETFVKTPFAPEECLLADRIEPLVDGSFRLLGRSDRIVKVEGKRASLDEIERQVIELEWVSDAAAALLEERGRSFIGVVAILSPAGRKELCIRGKFRFERMLRQALAFRQELVVLPRRWRFVAALPRDHMGKRQRAEITSILGATVEREQREA